MKYGSLMFAWLAAVIVLALQTGGLCGSETPERKTEAPVASAWAEIRVVDAGTGRGVPLVELETVNSLKFVTDNFGRVAFHEPGLLGTELFFHVRSHGYEVAKDGFGIAGVRVTPQVGKPVQIKVQRKIVAQRLCRLTGEGRDRDSLLLGYKPPLAQSPNPGRVAGQDSIQTAVYRGKVFCIWGDTQRMEYPLGLFRTAGATTAVPVASDPKSDPAHGIAYDYFTDPKTGFVRAMMPLAERPEGVIWITAVFVLPDEKGEDKLVAHYSRRKGLSEELEQGLAVFDDDEAIFKSVKQLPLDETWRRPSGHPIVYQADGATWLLFGSPNPNVRVRAALGAVFDPAQYEAFTCARPAGNGKPAEPEIGHDGKPVWRWQKELPPTDSGLEHRWVKDNKLKPLHARFLPADAAAPADRVILHRGTVRWNEYRKRWLLVAGQIQGKSSLLGEVWYAEADSPTGPFATAVKIVTHDRQSFYNVCHHDFLDRDGGRTIHFEGTYTNDFSGNPEKTPRYNYNQVLYRLDLGAAALEAAQGK